MFAFVWHGLRSWKSAKAAGLLAASALAIGIGSATAIYTVVDAILLKPPPWTHGERFVTLFSSHTDAPTRFNWSSTSWLDLLDYQQRTASFDLFGIFVLRDSSLTAPGEPQHLKAVEVSATLMNGLGVNPLAGRWFGGTGRDDDNKFQAVISFRLWRHLGGDASMIGRPLTMDGHQYVVTGVMPDWFRFPLGTVDGGEFRTDVWIPLNPTGQQRERSYAGYFCYARLKPGVSMTQADADVKRVAAGIAGENPKQHSKTYTGVVLGVLESLAYELRPSLILLLGAAGALLLMTCANVAGLLLARSVARARETAIRTALGAGYGPLALQYFSEGLLVALAGAAGGILVSFALVRLVLSMAADFLPRADSMGLNWAAVGFAFGAAILCSVLVSLAPLWQAVRTLPAEALGDGVRSSAPARSRKLSRGLVVTEIAAAFALLSVGALLSTHLNRLLHTSPGLVPEGVITFSLTTDSAAYPHHAQLAAYQKRLIEAVSAIPGVSSAAVVSSIPLSGCCYETGLFPEWRTGDFRDTKSVSFRIVSPQYFKTLRIPLLRGTTFDEGSNDEGDTLRILIDDQTANRYWPGRDPLEAFARLGGPNGSRAKVIGVVGRILNRGVGEVPDPEMYFPNAAVAMNPTRFVVRSALSTATLMPAVRHAIRAVNPAQPVDEAETMTQVVLTSLTTERLQSFLTAFFALSAMLMAALGVYGVVSYSVRHRTVEIGTRMALGAVGQDVLRLVMADGLKMSAFGVGIGALVAVGAAFLMKAGIFGIRIDNPLPFAASATIVAGFTAIACLVPGWRATLVSPLSAIRDDSGSILRSARAGARTFAKKVSELIAGPEEAEAISEAMLMEFVDSSRHADSFRQAMQLSVTALREAMNCESARLLEKRAAAYTCAAGAPADRIDGCSLPADGLLMGRLRGYPYPLPLTAGDLQAWSRWVAAERPQHTAEIEALRASGAALAVPLLAKNELAGILLLGAPVGREAYSAAEKRALRICGGQFALMIENARLTDRMVEQEKLNRDLQLAAEVQKRLFPDKPPASSCVTLTGMSIPARSVGGDYYDFLDLDGQRIGIALADVAGKGVAAALIMSVVQASLRILASEDAPLATLAARMNRFLHRSTGSNAYATFFYAQVDQQKRLLRYVNAGHNPPCLVRCTADRSIEELPAGGTVIGLFPQTRYEEGVVELRPGDVLMAFTDGVPEAQNPQEEEFGEDRLKDLLRQTAGLPAVEIGSRIAAELKQWIGTAAQYDDLTFVLLKVNEEGEEGGEG